MHTSNPRFFVLLLMALFSLVGNPGASQADGPREYPVKAAFLYNIAHFVDWPLSTFKATDGRLRICIIGKDPFDQTLEDTLAKKPVREHLIEIHRNPPKTALQHCHVLYLSVAESSQMKTLHHHIAEGDVLTVGENLEFGRQGGMVQIFIENQKVQFALNLNAINQTNLKVSSKLLRLAQIISP